jgi:hypothetical protein
MSCLIVVDYENSVKFEPEQVPDNASVLVVLGKNQNAIPVDLVQRAQPLGNRVEWLEVGFGGPNAADFVLAYELGRRMTQKSITKIIILSRDKGFDALAKYLSQKNKNCVRGVSLMGPEMSDYQESTFEKICISLQDSPRVRPGSRKALSNFICNRSKKPSEDSEVIAVINMLFSQHLIVEDSGKLTYPQWK